MHWTIMKAVWQNCSYNMEYTREDINSQYDSPHDEEINLKELDCELKQQKQHQVKYRVSQKKGGLAFKCS